MSSILGWLTRNRTAHTPPKAHKSPSAIRIGVLGAANITHTALIQPCISHAELVIAGLAARDFGRAKEAAPRHGEHCKAYESYEALLADDEIDAIYIPLPNALHYEWTMRALEAGKHVLLEKPAGNTAEEVERMFAYAKKKNLVLLEAFHFRFHPAAMRMRSIVQSGELGALQSASAAFQIPQGRILDGDIRFKFKLGGGATTDLGCYAVSNLRFYLGSEPTVTAANPTPHHLEPEKIDRAMHAELEFPALNSSSSPSTIPATIDVDLQLPHWGPFSLFPSFPKSWAQVKGDEYTATYTNFIWPWIWHSIVITDSKTGKVVRTEKKYKFDDGEPSEDWWSTYRNMVEAFVHMVKGRPARLEIPAQDSVAQQRVLDAIYEASGLGLRMQSEYTPKDA